MADQDVELSFEDLTFGSEDKEEDDKDKEDKYSVFVTTTYGGKLNVPAIVKLAEQCGTVKLNSFRDKQSFGFIQFESQEGMDKALAALNTEIDGFKITVEKCHKITPGRDPRTHEASSEFKNSTLVLKNLPFQLKQEKLEEMLNALEWKPQSVSYLYDGTGMFRGMAFVKYKEIEQATKVFNAINNMDINSRKLRVEYKRKVAEAEVEDNASKLYEQLNHFKSNNAITELAFPCGSSFQRKQIHQLAEKLGLVHFSTGEAETRYVLVKKKDPSELPVVPPLIGVTPPSSSPVGTPGKAQPIKVHGGRKNSHTEYRQRSSFDGRSMSPENTFGSPSEKELSKDAKASRSFGASGSSFGHGSFKSPPHTPGHTSSLTASLNPGSLPTASPKYGNSALVFNRILSEGPTVSPVRQPKGPDGSSGFGEGYRKARKRE